MESPGFKRASLYWMHVGWRNSLVQNGPADRSINFTRRLPVCKEASTSKFKKPVGASGFLCRQTALSGLPNKPAVGPNTGDIAELNCGSGDSTVEIRIRREDLSATWKTCNFDCVREHDTL
jgi:hypothetical protein